jgi:hypothetical protein
MDLKVALDRLADRRVVLRQEPPPAYVALSTLLSG